MSTLNYEITKNKMIEPKPESTLRLWCHKKTGKKFRVTPWWEMPSEHEVLRLELGQLDRRAPKNTKNLLTKFGVISQVGWLLETKEGMWVGMSPSVAKFFEDLGPAPEGKFIRSREKTRKTTRKPPAKRRRSRVRVKK